MFSSRLMLCLPMPWNISISSGEGRFPPRGSLQAHVPMGDHDEHSTMFLFHAESCIKPQALDM